MMVFAVWAMLAGFGAEDAAKAPSPQLTKNAVPDDAHPDGFKRQPAATFKLPPPGAGALPYAPGEQMRAEAHDRVSNNSNLGNCEIALLRSKEIGIELKFPKADWPTLALAADELEARNKKLEKLLVEDKLEQAREAMTRRPQQDQALLSETLSKEQLTRLRQLILYYHGPRRSIADWPEIAARVGIDREEYDKLEIATAISWDMEMSGMVKRSSEFGLYRAAKDRRFLAQLSDKQRAAWDQLVGPPPHLRRHPDGWPDINN